jgi:2-dehydropantoate 2-reductase
VRFIIYGAGAIGGTMGGRLALSGNDVLLVDLPERARVIQEEGLRLSTPQHAYSLQPPVVAGAESIDFQADDVVLLCVKSQDAEEALRQLSSAVKDVPIFCVQNGVRNEEFAARHFDRVYGVMIRGAALCLQSGDVMNVLDPPGVCAIGRFPDGEDDLAQEVAASLRDAGYGVRLTPRVMEYKWGKLIRNLKNAPRAIADRDDATTQQITEAARAEARPILKAAGVDWVPQSELEAEWNALQIRDRMDVQSLGSTWQSLVRREGVTEVEFLSGEVVRVAERVGMDAPINRELTRIVVDMAAKREPPGRYTPEELGDLLGLRGIRSGEE